MERRKTVWSGGKGGDYLKALPITIIRRILQFIYYINFDLILR